MATYDLTQSIPSPDMLEAEDILNCPYSGARIRVTLPKGQYRLEVWGARGGWQLVSGTSTTNLNGDYNKGGFSTGVLSIVENTTIWLYSGENPTYRDTSSFNGGGAGRYSSNSSWGLSGGGASDIRIGTDSLYARVIVAGGGGGSGMVSYGTSKSGGYGGGATGGMGDNGSSSGYGGTQTAGGRGYNASANGSFGGGGNMPSGTGGGGGGGGWYGGGAHSCGGGGSGFVLNANTAPDVPSGYLLGEEYYLANSQTFAGNQTFEAPTGGTETGHSGNGYCRITVLSLTPAGGGRTYTSRQPQAGNCSRTPKSTRQTAGKRSTKPERGQ